MRCTSAKARKKRIKRALKSTQGMYGRKNRCYKFAKQFAKKKIEAQYIGRIRRKRTMRSLWIQRISSAVKSLLNMSYSVFMGQMIKNGNILNRKSLSELAIMDTNSFKNYCGSFLNKN